MNRTQLHEIMTSEVVTLDKGQAAPTAQELLRVLHVRHLPVVNKRRELIGLVTHRKLLVEHARLLQQVGGEGEDSNLSLSIPISKVMETRVQRGTPEMYVADALELLLAHRIGSLPVVDEDDKVVGIVTSADFLGFQLRKLRSEDDEPKPSTGATAAAPEARADRLAEHLVAAMDERLRRAEIAARPTRLMWVAALVALVALLVTLLVVYRASVGTCPPQQSPLTPQLRHTKPVSQGLRPASRPAAARATAESQEAAAAATEPARPSPTARDRGVPPLESSATTPRPDTGLYHSGPPATSTSTSAWSPRAPDAGRAPSPRRKDWVPEPVRRSF